MSTDRRKPVALSPAAGSRSGDRALAVNRPIPVDRSRTSRLSRAHWSTNCQCHRTRKRHSADRSKHLRVPPDPSGQLVPLNMLIPLGSACPARPCLFRSALPVAHGPASCARPCLIRSALPFLLSPACSAQPCLFRWLCQSRRLHLTRWQRLTRGPIDPTGQIALTRQITFRRCRADRRRRRYAPTASRRVASTGVGSRST